MSVPSVPARRWQCLLLLAWATALPAQAPPGNPMPQGVDQLDRNPVPGDPAAPRFQLGQDARKQGDLATARQHLLAALEFHPASPAILGELVLACADDADQRARWGERLVRALLDGNGRARVDPALRRAVAADEWKAWEKLGATRAAAAAEVARAAERLKDGKDSLGNGALARLYAELAHELMADAPGLYRAHGETLQQATDRFAPEYQTVIAALQRLMQRTPRVTQATADPEAIPDLAAQLAWQRQQEQSIRAARILAGIARQAAFQGRPGPTPPELGDLAGAAAEARDRLQAESQQRVARVWTIAELEAMDARARSDFTLAHRQWSAPGIALSPNGLYRIETVCGFETLLGAAQTIELHHRRLVHHFGSDPFAQRQGTVRIVPEHRELEAEGVPHWWAAGFQAGDRTVIRFAWSNLPAMGRLLTHELTHRFDGTFFPFQPGWLVEGHATWTGAAYGAMAEDHFADRYLNIGACVQAYTSGYGRPGNLRKLLEGPEDYRDNYGPGCALYTFLLTWPIQGEPKYRARLDEFRKNGRAGGRDPVGFFTRTFCDGRDGRPGSLDEFATEFEAFLEGIYRWTDRRRDEQNRWIGSYQLDLGPGDQAEMVRDEPTWSWDRSRAEPWFGQGHMAAAGELLAEVGEDAAAAAAWLWSLQADGWLLRTAVPLPPMLARLGRKEAAFAANVLGRIRYPAAIPAPDAAPMLGSLTRLRAHLEQLRKDSEAAHGRGQPASAQLLRAEHDRLAALLALPALAAPPDPVAVTEPPRLLGAAGWTEDGLTGFEDRRHRGLWFFTPELDLHVGREKPRDATGLRDRASHQRDAFVRTVDWQPPGAYVIRTRLHFTTAYASGAVLFGHLRRDRGMRLLFRAGDFRYAIGKNDTERGGRRVWLELQGLWERDGQLPGSQPAFEHEMQNDATGLALELHVHGPSVLVVVDGEAVMRYGTHDGAPLEGAIGFATGMGAIRVQQPTVQRLDRAGAVAPAAAVAAVGLDLDAPVDCNVEDLLLRPVRGLPRGDCGTMVLWLPPDPDRDGLLLRLRRLMPYLAGMLGDPLEYPQQWVLAVPQDTDDQFLGLVQGILAERHPQPMPVLRHRWTQVFTGDPWVLFVDEPGLLRGAAQMGDVALFSRVGRWARLFRRR